MERGEGIRRVGRLVGVDSLDRNMVAEDEAFGRVMNRKKATPDDVADDDEMRILAGGNVTINPPPEKQPAPTSTATATATAPTPTPAPATVAPEKKKSRWILPALVATSLLGGGGAGYIAYDLLHPAKDTDTDTDTISFLDFPDTKGTTNAPN